MSKNHSTNHERSYVARKKVRKIKHANAMKRVAADRAHLFWWRFWNWELDLWIRNYANGDRK